MDTNRTNSVSEVRVAILFPLSRVLNTSAGAGWGRHSESRIKSRIYQSPVNSLRKPLYPDKSCIPCRSAASLHWECPGSPRWICPVFLCGGWPYLIPIDWNFCRNVSECLSLIIDATFKAEFSSENRTCRPALPDTLLSSQIAITYHQCVTSWHQPSIRILSEMTN